MLNWEKITEYAEKSSPEPSRNVSKSDNQWMEQLSDEQYRVTRQHGTERPFSSPLCSLFELGLYGCICCDTELFDANVKFDSGTGWPSFTQPITDNAIAYISDKTHGMYRIETICNTCKAHLGHVFPDGPEPTGLRYCMNAVALKKLK